MAAMGMSRDSSQTCPNGPVRFGSVRLIVARCDVRYTGRLTAVLPEATRLLIFKSDGSVLVHADAGGYEPLDSNMTW
jgi:RecB family endonuclease NucS